MNKNITTKTAGYNICGGLLGVNSLNSGPQKIACAKKYISKIECAVAGENGHKRTFHVACVLVKKFGLPYDDAFKLLSQFSDRCKPPWSTAELNHKLIDALAQADKPVPVILRNDIGDSVNEKGALLHPSKPKLFKKLPFTMVDIASLAVLRKIAPHGIKLAVDRGFLIKAIWYDHVCFGVHDKSGNAIELRRLDGELFPAGHGLAKRKSHSLRGSNKHWPIGIIEAANYPAIALVEGIPDFIFAHYRICQERAHDRVAVIGMLSATPNIDASALKYFKNKVVRIFPHLDKAGLDGARRWHDQLIQAGASHVDFFDLSGLTQLDGRPVKDLCDITAMQPNDFESNESLHQMMP